MLSYIILYNIIVYLYIYIYIYTYIYIYREARGVTGA